MIRATRDPATIPQMIAVYPRDRALALLLVDEDDDVELEQLLQVVERQERGGPEFVEWARTRHAAR